MPRAGAVPATRAQNLRDTDAPLTVTNFTPIQVVKAIDELNTICEHPSHGH